MRRAMALVVLLAACTSTRLPQRPPATSTYTEEGLASWYGEPYHGRPTASGATYNMHAMTAAHRTLPFGTWIMVTNLENRKQAEVLVNDRGPFVPGRILDLSRAAAASLGMLEKGVARVRLEVVRWGDGMVAFPCWEVQVGAFARPENVERAKMALQKKGWAIRTAPAGGGRTRVRVTGLAGRAHALEVARALAADFPGAMAVPCSQGSDEGKP